MGKLKFQVYFTWFLFAVIVCYAQIVRTSIFIITMRAVNNIFVNISVYNVSVYTIQLEMDGRLGSLCLVFLYCEKQYKNASIEKEAYAYFSL